MKSNQDLVLNELKTYYILSRNRSGSTLLVNLLNNHPSLLCISELNVYWLLKSSYEKTILFDEQTITQLVDDLFFALEKKSHLYFEFMLPSKIDLIQSILRYKGDLDFSMLCRIINLQIKSPYNKKQELVFDKKEGVEAIIKKEINFNHLIDKIYLESPETKFILLVRNHRANIYSSLKFGSARNNYIYEAKRWFLEMRPLLNPSIPNDRKLIIKYKDLINNTENCIEKIEQFLEIEPIKKLTPVSIQIDKNLLYEQLKEYGLSEEQTNTFIKHHYGSFSQINQNKINEWEYKRAFDKKQLNKIDYLCKDVAIPLGFKCSTKKVSFSIKDRFYILLAIIDYYVVTTYLTMPVKYKRVLAKLNYFKFFN